MDITISNQTYTIKRVTPTTTNVLATAYHVANEGATDTTDRLLALALMVGIMAGDIETDGQTVADGILNSIRAKLA